MELDSRLEEIRQEQKRRRPMTPAEMVRFYRGTENQPPSRASRFRAALIETLTTTLSQTPKSKKPTQTARPACKSQSYPR
jgi:hypothetical protein